MTLRMCSAVLGAYRQFFFVLFVFCGWGRYRQRRSFVYFRRCREGSRPAGVAEGGVVVVVVVVVAPGDAPCLGPFGSLALVKWKTNI